MMYVNVNYHTNAAKVGTSVRYIAHREEALPAGQTRALYGIGPRYRELRGDENAIVRRLREDGSDLKQPHFYRAKFTVDDPTAERLMALPIQMREWALRQAMEKTFDGAFRRAQGAFVIHYHGGAKRPFGHPHIHAVLSPKLQDGAALQHIPKEQLKRIKERWEVEIQRATGAYGQRVLKPRDERVPLWALTPLREPRHVTSLGERLLALAARRTAMEALGRPTGALLKTAADARAIGGGASEIFKRLAPRLALLAPPGPLRTAFRAARLWSRLTSGGNGNGSGD